MLGWIVGGKEFISRVKSLMTDNSMAEVLRSSGPSTRDRRHSRGSEKKKSGLLWQKWGLYLCLFEDEGIHSTSLYLRSLILRQESEGGKQGVWPQTPSLM